MHDGLLVHASDPNRSDRRRCGFVIRYVPTCAYPIQVRETAQSGIHKLTSMMLTVLFTEVCTGLYFYYYYYLFIIIVLLWEYFYSNDN